MAAREPRTMARARQGTQNLQGFGALRARLDLQQGRQAEQPGGHEGGEARPEAPAFAGVGNLRAT